MKSGGAIARTTCLPGNRKLKDAVDIVMPQLRDLKTEVFKLEILKKKEPNESELILYQTEDGKTKLEVRPRYVF